MLCRRPSSPPSLASLPSVQALIGPSRASKFSDILCCRFEDHLVKPRSTINSRPNLNLNKTLRIEPIRPRSGSFVHFPGFSSHFRTSDLRSSATFFRPTARSSRRSFSPPHSVRSRYHPRTHPPPAGFLPCRSVSSVVNSSIVSPAFAIRRVQHPPAARTEALYQYDLHKPQISCINLLRSNKYCAPVVPARFSHPRQIPQPAPPFSPES
jgi:hypothetical protein